MTLQEVVMEEAAKFGIKPAEDEIEFIIWEKTGYPYFWPDINKTPEENFRAQLQDFFSGKTK